MSNLLDKIVSDAQEKVNNSKSFILNDLQIEKPIANIPVGMEKLIYPDTGNPTVNLREWKEETTLSQINHAFRKLKEGAESNKLSDTFRSEGNQETRSETKRSLEKTIASYSRYYSILQAFS